MDRINCLYVDDIPTHRARYARAIEIAWQTKGMAIPITVETAASPEEAMEKLKTKVFALLVADIIYREGKEKVPSGLQLIAQVRSDPDFGNTLGVIALSLDGQWSKDALNNGAHDFLPKQFLDMRDHRLATFGESLLAVLRKVGYEPIETEAVELKFDSEDARLAWLVEWVGRQNLISLASKVLDSGIGEIEAGFVRSGFSGPTVVRLDCKLTSGPGGGIPIRKKILLKVTRDRELLAGEIERYEVVGKVFPTQLFASAIGTHVHECRGWYCLGLEFLDRAQTLQDWLCHSVRPDAPRVEAAMRGLFLEGGLVDVYRRFERRGCPASAFRSVINPARKAAVVLALEDMRELVRRHGDFECFDEELVRDYLAGRGRFKVGTHLSSFLTWAHGDLHSRNVLVDRGGNCRLVDAGSVCELPWPGDIARLSTDLLLCLDSGAEGHEWNRMSEWLSAFSAFLSGEKLSRPIVERNESVSYALEWIRGNLDSVHPEVFGSQAEYEFRLAMAVEALRSCYRREISSPKRVLGLVSFCLAQRAAEDYFERQLRRK